MGQVRLGTDLAERRQGGLRQGVLPHPGGSGARGSVCVLPEDGCAAGVGSSLHSALSFSM